MYQNITYQITLCYEILEQAKLICIDRKKIGSFLGLGAQEQHWLQRSIRECLGERNIPYLDRDGDYTGYTYAKNSSKYIFLSRDILLYTNHTFDLKRKKH